MELAKGLREIQKLEGHTDKVWSLAWNPVTGVAGIPLSFASCSGDKTVRIWEHNPSSSTSSWDCKAVLDETHTRTVRSCAWSPSGKFLATASFDATTAIWENVGGDYECVSTLEIWADEGDDDDWACVQTLGETNNGHSSTVWALSFNDGGDKMVTCSDDLTLKIWGTDNEKMQSTDDFVPWRHLCTLSGYHDRTIFSVHWSRDNIIASGAADDTIRFFVENDDKDGLVDGPSYKLLLKKEKAHDMDINSVQWSPGEDRILASAADDGTIKIWELTSAG
ncbi:hypothetical protein PRUPE_7G110600 [Prunus persica]|uniref:Uncharacterized protein n=1 Tax=Prunus persica TaxID=3760 RepID=A0A251ND25_PRUPE|nr:hypothetical protein PRUPE_7G110600 [Prunus persica]